MTCLPAKPFMGLGDSSHAPVLDYNMEVRSCLDAVVMIPIRIPIEYIKAEWFVKPIPNIWDTIKDMTWEQILAEVQAVLSGVPGQFGIFINSHLLDGTNVHWDFEEGETIDAPNVLGGGYPVSPIGGGGTPTKGGAYAGGGSTPIKGGAYTGGGSPIKGGGANTLALNGSDLLAIATNINNGLAPMISSDLYGVLHIEWLREPKLPRPTFYMVNHLKICTYAGNYGAGKTVHTHTLYPDEIFNFSLRTYKKIESVRLRTDNVLDSFSQSSSESLEKIIDKNKTTVDATTLGLELGAKIGAKFGIVFPVDVIDAEVGADGNIGGKTTYSKALTKTVQDLSHTIDKHCAESAASRVIQVNTSTTDSVLTEEEQTITRVIKNINKSRTLNIVHMQLHQQYLSITYLNEVIRK